MTNDNDSAVVTLQPWDNYPRPFQIYQDNKLVVSGTLAVGSWNVSGKVDIYWSGYFTPSGDLVNADHYSFSTDNCTPDQEIEIGYIRIDPAKPDSVIATCTTTTPTTQTPTTASTLPPTTSTTWTPPSTAQTPPTSLYEPPRPLSEPPGITYVSVTTPTPLPELPVTGSEVLPLIFLGVACMAVGMALARRFKK